ncbi:hypothetical protein B0J11DRAFT_483522 [Dendryphion nanum]|uniref:PAC domain-containing protein n=1 Tax=Dendryphion nanum TaxID=256645 RepID=A0A9P9E681_9PLEO|nr:hypothetical protein B0J11DRAFT_483522 [Dendryphion nanum]
MPKISDPRYDSGVEADHDIERFSSSNGDRRFSTLSAYDLAAPPPRLCQTNGEYISERLFSADHLSVILRDPVAFQRFTNFLNRYRPLAAPNLVRYIESQKALTAIRYANALAEQVMGGHPDRASRRNAAVLDARFEGFMRQSIEELVNDTLPAYLTYQLIVLVTEMLVKEITGSTAPILRDVVHRTSEVYFLSDPSLPDDPIVFASQEFYNTTLYGQAYVIGKNWRFLCGPHTQAAAIKRIYDALNNGMEICEVLLNYRRDGSPFLNLMMMAPLMDHRGRIRYVLGRQIDITQLIEGGRGLETFKNLLASTTDANVGSHPDPLDHKPPIRILKELGNLLNDEEADAFSARSRPSSFDSSRTTPLRENQTSRILIGIDGLADANFWPAGGFGPSGRLPGIYQNYMLVRPYPSLRIIFTSASLRIPGLSQSRLMDRIGGPAHVKAGLVDALAQGVSVTAKISWLTRSLDDVMSHQPLSSPTKPPKSPRPKFKEGKPRWIHCTPLLGSDSRPGVIMIVMIDQEEIAGTLNRDKFGVPQSLGMMKSASAETWPPPRQKHTRMDSGGVSGGSGAENDWASKPRLYAEYLRREVKDLSLSSRKHSAPELRGQIARLGNGGVNGAAVGNAGGKVNGTEESGETRLRVVSSVEDRNSNSRASSIKTLGGQRGRKSSV